MKAGKMERRNEGTEESRKEGGKKERRNQGKKERTTDERHEYYERRRERRQGKHVDVSVWRKKGRKEVLDGREEGRMAGRNERSKDGRKEGVCVCIHV